MRERREEENMHAEHNWLDFCDAKFKKFKWEFNLNDNNKSELNQTNV